VGPNGKGKSTLLKMIASRDLILPPRVDFLYVEQEVQADDTPAVDAVLKADKVRWNLLEEEKALTAAIDAGEEDPKKFTRLQDVLDELNTMGASSAEAKARRILFGLGFDGEMQTKVRFNNFHQNFPCREAILTYAAHILSADQNVLWWMEDAYFTRTCLVH
jgi:ATP-binding cassette subfamily F protein 1